jgi:hypothetical protein
MLSVELFENCNGKSIGKFANSAFRIIEIIVEYIETLQYRM